MLVTVRDIAVIAANEADIDHRQMFRRAVRNGQGGRGDNYVARVRQVAMWAAQRTKTASTTAIGAKLGGRDHSTVWYGIGRIEAELARGGDPELAALCERVLKAVEALKAAPPPRFDIVPQRVVQATVSAAPSAPPVLSVSPATVAALKARTVRPMPRMPVRCTTGVSSLVPPTPEHVSMRLRMERAYPGVLKAGGTA